MNSHLQLALSGIQRVGRALDGTLAIHPAQSDVLGQPPGNVFPQDEWNSRLIGTPPARTEPITSGQGQRAIGRRFRRASPRARPPPLDGLYQLRFTPCTPRWVLCIGRQAVHKDVAASHCTGRSKAEPGGHRFYAAAASALEACVNRSTGFRLITCIWPHRRGNVGQQQHEARG